MIYAPKEFGFLVVAAVSSFIFRCVECRKFRKCTQEQKMADLPLERMEANLTFTVVWTVLDHFM